MEPVAMALICAVVFGVVAGLTAFVRQLLLSRDKKLNDLAQQRALIIEANELEKLRNQMSSNKRFDSHYHALGGNKDAIQYLDQKIEDIFLKKAKIIERYAQVTVRESSAIITGEKPPERKALCDKLKEEIDNELKLYNSELELLQKRRANLWDSHIELQDYLLEQEKKRDEHLDNVYQQHTSLLEKIYFRHNENSENIAKETIQAGNLTYKSMLQAPIDLLMSFFKGSANILPDVASKELKARKDVADAQMDINGKDPIDNNKLDNTTIAAEGTNRHAEEQTKLMI